jgi:Tetracyclin repressor-like, C-terminal domain
MRTRLFHRLDSSCLATTRELSDVEVLSAISTRGRLYVQLPKPYVDQCELLDECIALFSAVEILPCRKSTWVQNNCLIAVSGSSNDGTAGLAADDSLFDFLMKNPQPLRLANWNRMERTGGRADPPGLAASVRKKRKAIAQAQTSGQLSTRFTAEDLLAFTTALVTSWDVNPNNLRQHREAIVDAVRLLTG